MARRDTTYTVFLSGPGDVSSDLELIMQILEDFNVLLSAIGIRFDPFHWASSATPGVSDSEAQDRIDRQSDDYDIIISLFGAKLGTPTVKYKSGTVQELSIALDKRHDLTFKDDSIMLLFKRVAMDNINGDLKSALDLQEYRKSLPKGILYKEFDDDASLKEIILRAFSPIIRLHIESNPLNTISPKGANSGRSDMANVNDIGELEEQIDPEDQDGLLEYVAIFEENINQSTIHTENISSSIQILGNLFHEFTGPIEAAGKQGDRVLATKIINDLAAAMTNAAEELGRDAEALHVLVPEALDALERAVEIQVADFGPSDTDGKDIDISALVLSLASNSAETAQSIADFSQTVAASPRMTKGYNKAKRDLLKSLESLSTFFEIIVSRGTDLASRAD